MKEPLGTHLRQRRTALNLGLRHTAARVGISPTYLSRVETLTEKSPPAETVLYKLAQVLGEDPDTLMHLAGRVAEDISTMITTDPSLPVFLRAARDRGLTGRELLALLDTHR